MTVVGGIALIVGVLGAFGTMETGINAWALTILGVVFFFAGVGMLNSRKDTDEVKNDN